MPGITKIQKWVKNIVTFLIGFYCLTGESGKHIKHNTKHCLSQKRNKQCALATEERRK